MKDVKEYRIFKKNYIDDLQSEVMKHIADGWYLYGSPFNDGLNYCQAMVR